MDKHTLSNYGWIIILTLVMGVMLAMASPFGNYVGDGIVNIANAYGIVNEDAVNVSNVESMSDEWENKFYEIGSYEALGGAGVLTSNGITIRYESETFPKYTQFNAQQITNVTDANLITLNNMSSVDTVCYNLTLTQNNKNIIPNKEVTVEIPVFENYHTGDDIKVFSIKDGVATEITATVENGNIIFKSKDIECVGAILLKQDVTMSHYGSTSFTDDVSGSCIRFVTMLQNIKIIENDDGIEINFYINNQPHKINGIYVLALPQQYLGDGELVIGAHSKIISGFVNVIYDYDDEAGAGLFSLKLTKLTGLESIPISFRPYIELEDGTIIYGDIVTHSWNDLQ